VHFRPSFSLFIGNLRYAILPLIVILGIVTAGLFFFVHGRAIMVEELKSRLQDTAALAAVQFDPSLIEQVQTPADMKTTAYTRLVTRLRNTRNTLPNLEFAYIMRQTSDPNILTFVADADALSTPAELDRNHNNIVDEDEEPSFTGDTYDITDVPALHNVTRPTVDSTFTTDQWGTVISGYAPIRNADGKVIAILGVDMNAAAFVSLSERIFSPVAFLLIVVAGMMMGTYVLIVIRQRRLEAMQLINRDRTALMDLATHQLGAPLATFKWWIEILQEHRKEHRRTMKMNKEDDDAFSQLEEGTKRMDQIIESLRAAVHMQNTQVQTRMTRVGISTMMKDVQKVTEIMLKHRKQKIVLQIPASLSVNVDRKLCIGVLQELVENASFYSPDTSTITVRVRRSLGHNVIEVEDHGYGIPKSDQAHIFQQFSRASNATLYKPVGNGLGLYIAKNIIQSMKGDIQIKSTSEKGTTFVISLPSA
jgi:signal transduction histidine kinase